MKVRQAIVNNARRLAPWLAALLVAAVLPACGPGEGGTGALSSGIQVGPVDGFGSVVIDGEAYDDRSTLVRLEESPAFAFDVPVAELELGVQTSARVEVGRIVEGNLGALVVGPVDADSVDLDREQFTILGQTVSAAGRGSLRPVLEGLRLGDLVSGQHLEVHGLRRSDGVILATRIERRSAQGAAIRVVGEITALDLTEQVLSVGPTRVRFGTAQILPDRAALAVGRPVTIFSTMAPARDGAVEARVVRVGATTLPADTELRVTGLAQPFGPGGNFSVQGIAVEAGRAALRGVGSLNDLRPDDFVRVNGVFDGARLQAREIAVLDESSAPPISIFGTISDFASPTHAFRLRGVTVRLPGDADLVGGTVENLASGVDVLVRGRIVDGELRAERLELTAPRAVMVGRLTGYDPAAGTFQLTPSGRILRIDAGATVRNGTLDGLSDGRRVRVYGRPGADAFVVQDLQFLDNDMAQPNVLSVGIPSGLDIDAGQFHLNGNLFHFNAQTRFYGGPMASPTDLRRGDVTIVRAVRSGGKLVAVEVESRFNFDRRESLVGFVTDFEGPDRIRIAGQASDIAGVTDATFVGRRAGLRNGGWVLVQGTLQRGTMLAWKLVILEE